MSFAKLAVAAALLGAASVSADSIAFSSRPIIKVGSSQMKVKAIMEYDFATHQGSCAGGEAPAIHTRFHSAADSVTAGISNSYSLTSARSRGEAKQALSVDSYVSGQVDLQLDAWGPCAEGDVGNSVATLAGFTYASLAIVSAAEIRGPIDGVYTTTVTFDYDVGGLAGSYQAKASLKLDAESGTGPSSAVSLDGSSGTGTVTIDVTEQFSAANADAPSTLLLYISPDSDFADFANRVISTTQTDFTYVEDFGPNGRQGVDYGSEAGDSQGEGGGNKGGGESGSKGMGGSESGGKGYGGSGTKGGKGSTGGSKGYGSSGTKGEQGAEGGSKGHGGSGTKGEKGEKGGFKGYGGSARALSPAAAAKSTVGLASAALIVGGAALIAVRRRRASTASEAEKLLPTVAPEL